MKELYDLIWMPAKERVRFKGEGWRDFKREINIELKLTLRGIMFMKSTTTPFSKKSYSNNRNKGVTHSN